MFSGCKRGYCLPVDPNKGTLVPVLNEEEQTYFEKQLGVESGGMSPYRKGENFWHKFYVTVNRDGTELNLADVMDNLRWRLLKNHPEIAPSWHERFNSPQFKFALVEEDVEIGERVKLAEMKKKVYKFLAGAEDNRTKMYDLLRVLGRRPAPAATKEWMISELDKYTDDRKMLKELLAVINDPLYEMKLFIEDGMECGTIKKLGRGDYGVVGLDQMFSQAELIEFLSPRGKHQDIYLKIKGQIDQYRKVEV